MKAILLLLSAAAALAWGPAVHPVLVMGALVDPQNAQQRRPIVVHLARPLPQRAAQLAQHMSTFPVISALRQSARPPQVATATPLRQPVTQLATNSQQPSTTSQSFNSQLAGAPVPQPQRNTQQASSQQQFVDSALGQTSQQGNRPVVGSSQPAVQQFSLQAASPQLQQTSPLQPAPQQPPLQGFSVPPAKLPQVIAGGGFQQGDIVLPQLTLAERRQLCGKLPDQGECRAAFPRYFFNPETNQCDCFLYGGCGDEGLDSSYSTLRECQEVCQPALLTEGPTCAHIFRDDEQFFGPAAKVPQQVPQQVPGQVPGTVVTTGSQPGTQGPTGGVGPSSGAPALLNGGTTPASGGIRPPSGSAASLNGGADLSGGGVAPASNGVFTSGSSNSSRRATHPMCERLPTRVQCAEPIPRFYFDPSTSQCDCFLSCRVNDSHLGFSTLSKCHESCHPRRLFEGPTCKEFLQTAPNLDHISDEDLLLYFSR